MEFLNSKSKDRTILHFQEKSLKSNKRKLDTTFDFSSESLNYRKTKCYVCTIQRRHYDLRFSLSNQISRRSQDLEEALRHENLKKYTIYESHVFLKKLFKYFNLRKRKQKKEVNKNRKNKIMSQALFHCFFKFPNNFFGCLIYDTADKS